MIWHGWVWEPRRGWQCVCTAETILECCRRLEQLRPGLANTRYAVTTGAVPDWTPGLLEWEQQG